jgi:DNA-binding MarR family transcriptional regulator
MNSKELLKLDNQLCFSLYAANRAMTKMYKPLLDPFGLTYPQYLVLLVLFESDGLGVNDLGERLYLDSGTLTPLLKRMEKSGLLNRMRSKEDERRVAIVLTDEGKALENQLVSVPLSLCQNYDCDPEAINKLRLRLKELTELLYSK